MLVCCRSLHRLFLGTALAVAACNKPNDAVVAPDASGGPATTWSGAPIELTPVDHPSQLMPPGTALLLTGTSMTRVAEVLERDRLAAALGEEYTLLRSAIVDGLGHDLLDPKAWPEVGLDPGGMVGLAVSDLDDPPIGFIVTVSDRRRLVDFVRNLAGKAELELVEEAYGSASILRPKDGSNDVVIMLRDRFMALVFAGDEGNIELARQMATMDSDASLASRAAYRSATEGLQAADMVAYMDFGGILGQPYAGEPKYFMKGRVEEQANMLEQARKRGAPPDEIAELEQQLAKTKAKAEPWRQRAEIERASTQFMVSGIEGVALAATVERSGLVFGGRVVAGPDAFMRRLVANRSGASALPMAMNGALLSCYLSRIDPATALGLLEEMRAAGGQDPTWIHTEAKDALGLDVKADLVPVLGGDMDLCLAVEGDPSVGLDPGKQLHVGVTVQVTDAAAAKRVLAKIATSGSRIGKRVKQRGEGYTVEYPPWGTVHVQIAGELVVASTDPELAKRLAAGVPGSMPSKLRTPAAMGAIGLPGTTITGASDLSLFILRKAVDRMIPGMPPVSVPGFTPAELEKVPLSARSKQAKKALEEADAELDAFDAKRNEQQAKFLLRVLDGLGVFVLATTEDDRGFTMTGGQFLRAESLGHVLEVLIQALNEGPVRELEPAEEARFMKARDRWEALREAYAEARMEDGRKYLEKRGKAAPVSDIAPVPEK